MPKFSKGQYFGLKCPQYCRYTTVPHY